MISYNEKTATFYLETKNTSYIIHHMTEGQLQHVYYGERLPQDDMRFYNQAMGTTMSPPIYTDGKRYSYGKLTQEYPAFGRGDFRGPAVSVIGADGRGVNELLYVSHKILDSQKPQIKGLPQLDHNLDDVDTLEILLRDEISGFEVTLSYSVCYNSDVIARHASIRNIAGADIKICSAMSANVDFDVKDFDMISLQGTWADERSIDRYPLHKGTCSIESRRCSSSHRLNPFAALASKNADEDLGDVYGFALVYSGNFRISGEVNVPGDVRLQIGINPDLFEWVLADGETFDTPEALLTYSHHGFNGMSQNFHAVCRAHLGKCADKSTKHPIVLNSWEGTYFSIDEKVLTEYIKNSAGFGIDTFVVDDGWFGKRDNDLTSLGDWYVDKDKFPNGLTPIIDLCHKYGMDFGIWFEPEMISTQSKLYEQHPDWVISVPGRKPLECRNQLVLDFSSKEVTDAIYEMMDKMLTEYDIRYIKWDYNRNITENGSNFLSREQQGEHAHRYILGVYSIIDRLQKKFPHVFFEGCSGGGGRFDFGMLYYTPQIWASDNSDAGARLKIQYGTSYVYPQNAISAHISQVPNSGTDRIISLETRANVAQLFSFGCELNPAKLTDEEKEKIKEEIKYHKEIDGLVNDGTFYRLANPFTEDFCAWQIVSEDKKRSVAMFSFMVIKTSSYPCYIRFKGLDENTKYKIKQTGLIVSGKTLMAAGIPLRGFKPDYNSKMFDIIAVD